MARRLHSNRPANNGGESSGAQGARTDRAGGSRLAYLDNLKVVLVAGVIVAHAAMTYGASGTWIFEVGDHEQPTLHGAPEVLLSVGIALGALFALGLFLLIAGMLTPRSVRRRGPAAFAFNRLVRLGVPLVAYVVVVWPLLGVLIDSTVGGARGTVWTQYVARLQRVDSGPMWFVAILLVFSLAYAAWATITPPAPPLGRSPLRIRQLLTAMVLITGGSFIARLAWPIDTHQIVDLHLWLWPQCAVLFVFGIIGFDRGWFSPVPDHVRRACGIALVVAVLVVIPVLIIIGGDEATFKGGLHAQAFVVDIFEGVFAVAMSLWLLAHFQRRHATQGPLNRLLASDAYGAFVAQGPVLVLLGLALYQIAAPTGIEFVALTLGGVAGSFGLAHGARTWTHRLRRGTARRACGKATSASAPSRPLVQGCDEGRIGGRAIR